MAADDFGIIAVLRSLAYVVPMDVKSWGGLAGEIVSLAQPTFSSDLLSCLDPRQRLPGAKCLVIGNLRSYGDEVLSLDGHYVRTSACDRILQVDLSHDTATVECGVSVAAVQQRIAPLGRMLPVTPGTAWLTVGGAIANDVHGKNHRIAGTFGCFVERFELVRSTGEALICSRTENSQWFAATIGGMGLTGAITWATLRLRRIATPFLDVQTRKFGQLADFFAIDAENVPGTEYAVAWIDCLAAGQSLGRGIYSTADHCAEDCAPAAIWHDHSASRLHVPFAPPISPINKFTLRMFNNLYFHLHRNARRRIHWQRWLYPLDAIRSWNRLYGRRGFSQFQCVVPPANAALAIAEMLQEIGRAREGSTLAVLKNFGEQVSPGLMSFPMSGTTLALDFVNRGPKTRALLGTLYAITAQAGGRLYAAKDGSSPDDGLRPGYPNFETFKRFIDPAIGSRFARRARLLG